METIIQKRPEPEAPKPDPVPPVPPTPPTDPVEPIPPAGPKNNTMAIVSLVLGILGLVLLCLGIVLSMLPFASGVCGCIGVLLAIGALVTGFMARNQIKTTGEGGNGMAMAGIVMGAIQLVLILCSIIVIVIVVLLGPSIGNVFSSINASMK